MGEGRREGAMEGGRDGGREGEGGSEGGREREGGRGREGGREGGGREGGRDKGRREGERGGEEGKEGSWGKLGASASDSRIQADFLHNFAQFSLQKHRFFPPKHVTGPVGEKKTVQKRYLRTLRGTWVKKS